MNINQLLAEVGNFNNSWGSYQYYNALAMFKAYFKLREKYSRPRGPFTYQNERLHLTETRIEEKSILEYLEEEFNYRISFTGIRTDEEARNEFFQFYNYIYKWGMNDLYDYDTAEKLEERNQSIIWNIRRSRSGDDFLFVGRQASSDLWNTAPRVAQAYFVNFTMENLPNFHNISNIATGLCCALLFDYGIVKNEKSFSGFDT